MAVRFEGVPPHTALARQLGSQFAPVISNFHLSQVQKRTASGLEVYKARGQREGLDMSYTYLHGQETLRIRVSPQILEPSPAPKKVGDYWQWALIDVYVPDAWAGTANGVSAKAYRRIPAPAEADQKFDGYAYSDGELFADVVYYSDGMDPFVISYPSRNAVETVIGNGTQICSLLVDMRRIPATPVTLDLYLRLDLDEVAAPGGFKWIWEPFSNSTGTFTGHNNGPFTLFAGYRKPLWADPFPNYATWLPTDNTPALGSNYVFGGSGGPSTGTMTLPSPGATVWIPYVEYWADPSTHVDTGGGIHRWNVTWGDAWQPQLVADEGEPPEEQERDVEVRGIGGVHPLDWAEVIREDEANSYVWVPQADLPGPTDTVRMGAASIASSADSEVMKLIGTVTIFPVQKTMSFTSAA
jgi:hypothetical protein